MSTCGETFAYDHVPYGSRVFPLSAPDRLATIATLYGLSPARPESCRMLDLGCGDGTNLLSMAYSMPNSQFVGIDLSDVHIEMAKDAARRLGTTNVEFVKADVSKIGRADIGSFDFISAHGLFSWVPIEVRYEILRLYSECLLEGGVGYISYNTFPGALMRSIAWDIMRYDRPIERGPTDTVARGRDILNFISEAASEGTYKSLLKDEAERISLRDDIGVFHDDFAEHNHPIYFHEFDSLLKSYGLQYVGEADPDTETLYNAHPEALKVIESLSMGDRTKREQYLDFLGGRRFRTSIICLADNAIADRPLATKLKGLLFSTELRSSQGSELTSTASVPFSTPSGSTLEISHPATKMALERISDAYPRSLAWTEILDPAAAKTDEDLELLSLDLLSLFDMGLLALASFLPEMAVILDGRPMASRFARLQIESGSKGVTTLAGPNVEIPQPLVRSLLLLLDGTRDQSDLVDELSRMVSTKELLENELLELKEMVQANLEIFLKLGLLQPSPVES